MAQDTQYAPIPFLFNSKGIIARWADDECPPNTYLNMADAEERQETAVSTRLGSVIINRDPNGTMSGQNYFFTNPIVSLSRLKSTFGTWRYAADDTGLLFRRTGDTQGQYTQIATGLSGDPFSAVVNTCYNSSTPYLFIADAVSMLKDSGTGSPTRIGIIPPNTIANTTPYAANILAIDNFTTSSGYTITGIAGWAQVAIGSVVSSGSLTAVNNFISFGIASGITFAFNGVIATVSGNSGSATLAQLFDVYGAPQSPQLAGYGINGTLTNVGTTTFALGSDQGSVGANSIGTVGKTVALDLSQNNQVTDDDLIVLTMMVTNPENVQQVNVQFDVNGSNYVNYYQKSIAPANYQLGVSGQTAPYTALADQVYASGLAQGKSTVSIPTGNPQVDQQLAPSVGEVGGGSGSISQLTPATLSTGSGAWITVYMRRGDFLPVGLAGQQNQTWASITGWQIQLITGPSGGPYSLQWTYPGKPPGCDLLLGTTVGQTVNFPGNFAGLTATVGTNPTSLAGFGIGTVGPYGQRNLGEVGINSSGVATFTTPGGNAVVIYAGETLTIFTPCPQDSTLSDVTIILNGETSTTAGTTFGLNGLYLQWGAGPSSYGGVGYDYRYTYYNINTGTESNGSQIQYSSEQFGTASSLDPLIVLRQAIAVRGTYSADPQTTHVRIYRRGGNLTQNGWVQVDQIANVTGTSQFIYKDIIPDASLAQASVLVLDNDVPVTSSLRIPINTTLSVAVGGAGANVYSAFGPVSISVAAGGTPFLLNQILVIGTPQNLEQVPVYQAGTGTCEVTLRLQHAIGEPVQAFSIPAQPVDLVELAYGQLWWAGDPNNPHYLYFSKPGYPENVGPQNYIAVSEPSDPIMAVINFRGTLFVATLTTWYQIIGGANPYAQPTGSKHGLVAKHGWCQTESAIWYQAADGIREFRGADGAYRTVLIEWLYRDENQDLSPIPFVDLSNIANVVMAFQNNFVYVVYPDRGLENTNSRLAWSTTYDRWRNDSINATTIFWEADTNLLLYCRFVPSPTGPGYAICQDRIGYTDDMGWLAGNVVTQPVAMNLQTPFQDLGKPHFTKQWNTLEIDADVGAGAIDVSASFSDGVILALGTLNLVGRQKYELIINEGLGHEAYSMSLIFTGSGGTGPPNIFQADIYAAILAANRTSFDTYWIKFGTDESKLIKEGYFDYTSTNPIAVVLYADGDTTAYYTFTLPTNPERASVPERVRFPAIKCRQWRCVATSGEKFQMWTSPQVSVKACLQGSGYAKAELTV